MTAGSETSPTVVVERHASAVQGAEATVVVPLGRFDQHVDEAVRSVIDQEGVVVHVVLALDGITLPDGWEPGRHPSVTVVRAERRVGIAAILNAGLQQATTDMVARMDGDDVSEPTRIRRQVDYLAAHPDIAVVGTFAVEIDGDGAVIGQWHGPHRPWSVALVLLYRNPVIHPSVMFRRSVVTAVGGYREDAEGVEDHDLWLRVQRVARIAVMQDELLRYRRHPHQVTSVARSRSHFDVLLHTKREGRGPLVRSAVTLVHEASVGARVLRDRVRSARAVRRA